MRLAPMHPKPARKISEGELQKAVIAAARARGFRVAHFRAAQVRPGRYVTPVDADGAGFPDLVLCRGERLIFAELKAMYKKPRPEQEAWLQALREAAPFGEFEVYCWTPRHWISGEIDRALR